MTRLQNGTLAVLLAFCGAFGGIHQIKVALTSIQAMTGPHWVPGGAAQAFVPELEARFGAPPNARVAYVGSPTAPHPRPADEYPYDAQYGLAPWLIASGPSEADCLIEESAGDASALRLECREK